MRFQIVAVLVLSFAALCLTADTRVPARAGQINALAVGDTAPDFSLSDQNGDQVMLSAARGKAPVVLVFYRGYW